LTNTPLLGTSLTRRPRRATLAVEIMNEIPQSLRNMIDARWREERMNALSIWFIVVLFQFLLRHFAFASVSAHPFVAILLPLGWLFPLLAVIHWFRWRSYQSDLKGGTVLGVLSATVRAPE